MSSLGCLKMVAVQMNSISLPVPVDGNKQVEVLRVFSTPDFDRKSGMDNYKKGDVEE